MKKKTIITLLVLLILSIAWYIYYQYDKENLKIDYYNFQQLEKAKNVVKNLKWEQKLYRARGLKDFNYQFDTDIEPLDKRYCYYVYYSFDKENNKPVFEFWFKLHSLLYKMMYMSDNYAYPKLIKPKKIPEDCFNNQWKLYKVLWKCADPNYSYFISAISEPCEK